MHEDDYEFEGSSEDPSIEYKIFDTVSLAQRIDRSSGTKSEGILIPDIGTSDRERIGRFITAKHIHIRGTVWQNGARTPTSATSTFTPCHKVRCIVYVDKQAQNGIPSNPTIMETAEVTSFLKWEYSNRFAILYDKCWVLDNFHRNATSGNVALGCGVIKDIDIEIPIDCRVSFYGSAGTEISTNAIYVLWLGEDTLPVSGAFVEWNSRVLYLDD